MSPGFTPRRPSLKLRAWTPTETERHKAIRRTLLRALPQRAQLIHYPAGIRASAAEWNRMRALGAVSGFPDLLCLLDTRAFTLEVKDDEGQESESQLEYAPLLDEALIPRAVVRDEWEAIDACAGWGLPLFGYHQRQEMPAGWRLAESNWQRTFAVAKQAWVTLCGLRPPPGTMHRLRFEADASLRQIHATI